MQEEQFERLFGLHNVGQFIRGLQTTPGADIDAAEAWSITTGSEDVVVAVLDTGVDLDHEDLEANLWRNESEIVGKDDEDDDGNGFIDDKCGCDSVHGTFTKNQDYDCGIPDDDDLGGHGTHVSGIIAAVGDNAKGITGVSWSSKIMALKVLDSKKLGYLDDMIRALRYVEMMRTRPDNPVNVVATNNSYIDKIPAGATDDVGFSDDMFDAIERLDDANVLFVAAAGNRDVNLDQRPYFPASYSLRNKNGTDELSNVITVGATDAHDEPSWRTNHGVATVDIAAPGVPILSTTPGNDYGFKNGTSMAASHGSGVAALVASIAPDYATAAEIRNAILRGAETLPSLAGMIAGDTNAGRRLNAHQSLEVDAYSPRAQLVSVSPVTSTDSFVDMVVEYQDDTAVVASSLNGFDIVVRRVGETGPPRSVTRTDAGGADSQTIRTTYRLQAPGPSWTVADNGIYEIFVIPDQVTDPTGNQVQPLEPTEKDNLLGSLAVNIADEAGELTVDREDDSLAAGTLRAAIRVANLNTGEDTIRLGAGSYRLSLTGTAEDVASSGDLDISDHLTIIGAGADTTVISGSGLDRVCDIHPDVIVTLQGLGIADGWASTDGDDAGDGGAVRNRGVLHLSRVALEGNKSDSSGGAIANLGGTLTVTQSLLADNLANQDGGGLYNTGTATVVNTFASWSKGRIVDDGGTGQRQSTRFSLVDSASVLSSRVSRNSAVLGRQ